MAHASAPKKSFLVRELSTRGKIVSFLALAVFTFAPLLSAVIASAVARSRGSRVDESSSHPCIIGGVDFGGLLYAMFVAGWLSLLTIPVGLMIMLVWMAMFMRETMGKIR